MRCVISITVLGLALGLSFSAEAQRPGGSLFRARLAPPTKKLPVFKPRYALINGRPVMALPTRDGGIQALALDMHTGKFKPHGGLMRPVLMGGADVDYLSRRAFAREVRSIRARVLPQRTGAENARSPGVSRRPSFLRWLLNHQ